jgi:WD40 repeat protein
LSFAWNKNHLLSPGSKGSTIAHHDVCVLNDYVTTLKGSTEEVCGLKLPSDGQKLASGGTDGRLCIWDAAASGSQNAPASLQLPQTRCASTVRR